MLPEFFGKFNCHGCLLTSIFYHWKYVRSTLTINLQTCPHSLYFSSRYFGTEIFSAPKHFPPWDFFGLKPFFLTDVTHIGHSDIFCPETFSTWFTRHLLLIELSCDPDTYFNTETFSAPDISRPVTLFGPKNFSAPTNFLY